MFLLTCKVASIQHMSSLSQLYPECAVAFHHPSMLFLSHEIDLFFVYSWVSFQIYLEGNKAKQTEKNYRCRMRRSFDRTTSIFWPFFSAPCYKQSLTTKSTLYLQFFQTLNFCMEINAPRLQNEFHSVKIETKQSSLHDCYR